LFVGYDATWLEGIYIETHAVGTLAGTDLGPPAEKGLVMIYCRGLRVTPVDLWADLRHFD
jgi:hypothetical protein